MGRITVREAAESDLPEVLRLLDQMDESMYPQQPAASEAELRELFRLVLQDPNQHVLLAETGGRAVGSAHLYVLQHFERRPKRSAVVEGVVVDPAYRGKGVGAALMRAVAERFSGRPDAALRNLERARAAELGAAADALEALLMRSAGGS